MKMSAVTIKVRELFEGEKISYDMIEDSTGMSDYWCAASIFIIENWNRPLSDLTEKQFNWAHRILDDMIEKRIEGRESYGNH